MYDWKNLADQLKVLQSQRCIWPKNLGAASKIKWEKYNRFVFQQLLNFIERPILNDALRIACFYRFFFTQASLYEKISDDPAFFSLPCDIACTLVAKTIAQPDHAVCQILRPTITRVIGSAIESDVKEGSENSDGHFDPKEFLLNSSRTALIAISPAFDLVARKIKYFWRTDLLQSSDELLDLTSKDLANLCESAGDVSRRYFAALEKIHRVHLKRKPSLAWEFEKLQKTLHESSKVMQGNETIADIEQCRKALIDFRRIWVSLATQFISDEKSPDDKRSTKEKICGYIVESNLDGKTFTIENYLLRLFSAIEEIGYSTDKNIAFTGAEKKILLAEETGEGLFPCAEQISKDFKTFLADNLDLDNIPIPGCETDFEEETLPTAAELAELSAALKKALLSRQPLNGNYDNALFLLPLFYVIAQHFSLPPLFPDLVFCRIPELAPYTNSLQSVVDILLLLPRDYWQHFISHYALKIDTLKIHVLETDFSHGDTSETENEVCLRDRPLLALLFFLQSLPPSDWAKLIPPLSNSCTWMPIFNGESCACLLYDLPRSQWGLFYNALGLLKNNVFMDVDDLRHFLVLPLTTFSIDQWPERILLFRKEIEELFEEPLFFTNLIIEISAQYWNKLFVALKPIFDTCLTDFAIVSSIAGRLNPKLRMLFFEAILPQISLNCFQHNIDMDAPLSLFDKNEDRIAYLKLMQPYISATLRITAKSACDLLEKYFECVFDIVNALRDQYIEAFTELFSAFDYLDENKIPVPTPLNKIFIFLMIKALPHIELDLSSEKGKGFFANIEHCKAIIQKNDMAKSLCEQTTQTDSPNKAAQTQTMQTRSSFFHGSSLQHRIPLVFHQTRRTSLPEDRAPTPPPRQNRSAQRTEVTALSRASLDLTYRAGSPMETQPPPEQQVGTRMRH